MSDFNIYKLPTIISERLRIEEKRRQYMLAIKSFEERISFLQEYEKNMLDHYAKGKVSSAICGINGCDYECSPLGIENHRKACRNRSISPCEHCDEKFTNHDVKREHKKECSGAKLVFKTGGAGKTITPCENCGDNRFKSQSGKTRHMKTCKVKHIAFLPLKKEKDEEEILLPLPGKQPKEEREEEEILVPFPATQPKDEDDINGIGFVSSSEAL